MTGVAAGPVGGPASGALLDWLGLPVTATALAALAGVLVASGVALALRGVLVDHVALPDAVVRLEARGPRGDPTAAAGPPANADARDRVGGWLARRVTGSGLLRAPERELALLRRPPARYWGDKVVGLLVGVAGPSVLGAVWSLAGTGFPLAVPVGLSLALGVTGWLLPDQKIRAEAGRARDDFRRAVASYVQLVALARAAGDGTQQALGNAAAAGDTWVFRRLRETLLRAELEGVAPWEGFGELADEYGVPELAELADVMRLAGEEGSSVYDQLRARARSQQEDLLSRDLASANAADERLTFPVAALVTVFTLMLALPALARLAGPVESTTLPEPPTAIVVDGQAEG